MTRHEPNPFDPDRELVPLELTFDGRSLPELSSRERQELDFLISLCDTDEIDGMVVWAREGFQPRLPAAVMNGECGPRDSAKVGLAGEKHSWIGTLPLVGQWDRLAAEYELGEDGRSWLNYYGTATSFHKSSKRHVFVTADHRLLGERREGPFQNIWRSGQIFSVREALMLAGVTTSAHGHLYEEVRQGYQRRISTYSARTDLAVASLPNRRRIYAWLEQKDPRNGRIKSMKTLEQSLHERAAELLRAREGVQREDFRLAQTHATVDEGLYHLRASVAAMAAACDSVAVLAALALELPAAAISRPQQISLRNSKFGTALRSNGGERIATASEDAGAFMAMVKAFRDPIIHQAGPTGLTVHHLGASQFAEMRISSLSEEQVNALRNLPGRDKTATRWGLRDADHLPSIAPLAFLTRLAFEGMSLLDGLLEALADDLGLPSNQNPDPVSARKLQRIRLQSGLDPQYEDLSRAKRGEDA